MRNQGAEAKRRPLCLALFSGSFSQSGPWRPAVVARLARTLGSTKDTVRYPNRKCACRRELNSPEGLSRETAGASRCLHQNKWSPNKARSRPLYATAAFIKRGAKAGSGTPRRKRHGTAVPDRTTVCVGSTGFQSVRRAAAVSSVIVGPSECRGGLNAWCPAVCSAEREASVVGHAKSQVPCQAHRSRSWYAVLPNPSLKGSTNGRPPGPGPRYGVHFLSPGPGILPLVPP